MAGTDIRVMDHVTPVLAAAIARLDDYRKPLSLAGIYQQRSFMRQFAQEGNPAWTPHSEVTVESRFKRASQKIQRKGIGKFTAKILMDNGMLRRSYTSRGAHSIWRLGKYELAVGSNLIYAAIHQYRGKAGVNRKVKIPARPLNILPEDRKEIAKIFERFALEAFK